MGKDESFRKREQRLYKYLIECCIWRRDKEDDLLQDSQGERNGCLGRPEQSN